MSVLLRSLLLVGLCGSAFVVTANEALDKIKQRVQKEAGQEPVSIKATPIKDLYEVVMGPRILYVSADGRYLFAGDIIDLEQRSNLTESKRDSVRAAALDSLGESSMISFGPKTAKHTITVFTDIDCGYCRKMHNEIAEYNKHGIRVRYLAFPRAGVGSESFNKAVSVWCAADRQKAMTIAKQGGAVEAKTCNHPVAQHYELGQGMGINGTPALILEDGAMYPGYAPAKQLSELLDKVKAAAKTETKGKAGK